MSPSHRDKSLEEVVGVLRLGKKHQGFGIAKYRSLTRDDFTELSVLGLITQCMPWEKAILCVPCPV